MAHNPTIQSADVGGATVVCVNDARFAYVRFDVAVKGGANLDADGLEGSCAVSMEAMLRGTTHKGRKAFMTALETMGSSLEAQCGHALATFSGTSLTRHLKRTWMLLCEALVSPCFAADEVLALVEENVQALISERDDDDAVADLFLRQSLYRGHRLAVAPVGTPASLHKVLAHKAAWHRLKDALVPKALVFSFAGDITLSQATALVEPIVEALAKKPSDLTRVASKALPDSAVPVRPRFVVVDKPERTQVQLRLARHGCPPKSALRDMVWLATLAFGGTFTSLLTREVRDVRGWSYFASAEFRRLSPSESPLVLRAAPKLEDAVNCVALMSELFDNFAAGNVEALAVASAKRYLLGRAPFFVATAFDVAPQATLHALLGLPLTDVYTLSERIEEIEAHTVGASVASALADHKPIATLVGPAEALVEPLRARFVHADVEVVNFASGAHVGEVETSHGL